MFVNEALRVMKIFETEPLVLDTNPMSNCSRIDVSVPNFYQAQAIASLFNLSNTSNQFSFCARRDPSDKNCGIINLTSEKKSACKKVDEVFIKTLKKQISEFSVFLSKSWSPYTDTDDLAMVDINKYEMILSKKGLEGTFEIYHYLNILNGNKIELTIDDDSNLIMGSKINVEGFLKDLETESKNIQKMFSI